MANSFLKPQVIANTTMGLLERELVLGSLVWTDHGIDFAGSEGDAVTLRVPARTNARSYAWRNDRSTAIVTDELAEDRQVVSLDQHIYNAVNVTDEELTLDIDNFGSRVLDPQARAIATELDGRIAAMIEGAPYVGTPIAVDEENPHAGAVDAFTALNVNHVGRQGRVMLAGSNFEAALLKSRQLADASQSGSDGALREATVGRFAGFTVVGSTLIDPDAAYAFVPSAFLVATRAPAIPAGVAFGAGASHAGYAMRWVRDYDSSHAQDRSLVSTFAGFNIMLDRETPGDLASDMVLKRAVKLELAAVPSP